MGHMHSLLVQIDRELDTLCHRMPLKPINFETPPLVISSGDVSDVDGFMALAVYAQAGADVMFVMNYPAYLASTIKNPLKMGDGRGYVYGARAMLDFTESAHAAHPCYKAYTALLQSYELQDHGSLDDRDINERMKRILTDLAFEMASKVWQESRKQQQQKLFFCIGGINDVNPFYHKILKNEALVYANACSGMGLRLDPVQGRIFNEYGTELSPSLQALAGAYRDVYVDFNGSMAFLSDDAWKDVLRHRNIRAALVMGGVMANEPPKTKPAMENVLNRLSCSTMNQLYSPAKTKRFFAAMKDVPVYVVCNNAVQEFDSIPQLLRANHMDTPCVRAYCQAYYVDSPYHPQKKPFDLYVAKVAEKLLAKQDVAKARQRRLFYDGKYGISLIGDTDWRTAVVDYLAQCGAAPDLQADRFREGLAAERNILLSARDIRVVNVLLPDFDCKDGVIALKN